MLPPPKSKKNLLTTSLKIHEDPSLPFSGHLSPILSHFARDQRSTGGSRGAAMLDGAACASVPFIIHVCPLSHSGSAFPPLFPTVSLLPSQHALAILEVIVGWGRCHRALLTT